MLRNILIAFLAVTLMGALVGRMMAAEDVKCEGTIMKIEGDKVTVKDMTQEQEMKIGPATKITSGGKPVSPMDLKVGQKVTCLCMWNENEMICTTMEIMKDTDGG